MLVALLAYRNLAPGPKANIAKILKEHPHYEDLLLEDRPENVTKEEWAFIKAATWPDMMRSPPYDALFHRQKWHFVNLPFVPPGEAAHLTGPKFETPSPNVLLAIDENKDLLAEKYPARARKAIGLAWLEHLVGDIHQPLHCSALVTRAYPQGDRGGNLLAVRKGNSVTSLHSYWDGVLGHKTDYQFLDTLARSIADDPASSAAPVTDRFKDLQPMSWAKEGLGLATEKAYLNGALPFADYDAYKKHQVLASQVPKLDDAYQKEAEAAARIQVLVAGNRLAQILNDLFDDSPHQ